MFFCRIFVISSHDVCYSIVAAQLALHALRLSPLHATVSVNSIASHCIAAQDHMHETAAIADSMGQWIGLVVFRFCKRREDIYQFPVVTEWDLIWTPWQNSKDEGIAHIREYADDRDDILHLHSY
jgi:hypothetical protein